MEFYENQIINDVTVIKVLNTGNIRKDQLLVRCNKCGRERLIGVRNILNGSAKTTFHKYCAFQIEEKYPKNFYSSWANMRTRTTNDNYKKADNYKNRNIDSEEFALFIDFYDAMYESYKEHIKVYGIENTTIERIDVNKSYTKENCTWKTWYEQAGNKTNNIKFIAISPQNESFKDTNLKKFCEEHQLYYQTIIAGINKNRHKNINKTKFRNGWIFIECND